MQNTNKESLDLTQHETETQLTNSRLHNTRQETIGLFEMNYTSLPLAVRTELKAEMSNWTLSAPGSDTHMVFAYSITDEVK